MKCNNCGCEKFSRRGSLDNPKSEGYDCTRCGADSKSSGVLTECFACGKTERAAYGLVTETGNHTFIACLSCIDALRKARDPGEWKAVPSGPQETPQTAPVRQSPTHIEFIVESLNAMSGPEKYGPFQTRDKAEDCVIAMADSKTYGVVIIPREARAEQVRTSIH